MPKYTFGELMRLCNEDPAAYEMAMKSIEEAKYMIPNTFTFDWDYSKWPKIATNFRLVTKKDPDEFMMNFDSWITIRPTSDNCYVSFPAGTNKLVDLFYQTYPNTRKGQIILSLIFQKYQEQSDMQELYYDNNFLYWLEDKEQSLFNKKNEIIIINWFKLIYSYQYFPWANISQRKEILNSLDMINFGYDDYPSYIPKNGSKEEMDKLQTATNILYTLTPKEREKIELTDDFFVRIANQERLDLVVAALKLDRFAVGYFYIKDSLMRDYDLDKKYKPVIFDSEAEYQLDPHIPSITTLMLAGVPREKILPGLSKDEFKRVQEVCPFHTIGLLNDSLVSRDNDSDREWDSDGDDYEREWDREEDYYNDDDEPQDLYRNMTQPRATRDSSIEGYTSLLLDVLYSDIPAVWFDHIRYKEVADWAREKKNQLSKSRIVYGPEGKSAILHYHSLLEEITPDMLTEGSKTAWRKIMNQLEVVAKAKIDAQLGNAVDLLILPIIPEFEDIHQITNSYNLKQEGDLMHHCVGGYINSCIDNKSFIYHIGDSAPAGATFDINPTDNKLTRFKLNSIYREYDRPVSADVRKRVEKFVSLLNDSYNL